MTEEEQLAELAELTELTTNVNMSRVSLLAFVEGYDAALEEIKQMILLTTDLKLRSNLPTAEQQVEYYNTGRRDMAQLVLTRIEMALERNKKGNGA